jgi:hypothetical protein
LFESAVHGQALSAWFFAARVGGAIHQRRAGINQMGPGTHNWPETA